MNLRKLFGGSRHGARAVHKIIALILISQQRKIRFAIETDRELAFKSANLLASHVEKWLSE